MESLHYLLMKSHTLMQKNVCSDAQKKGLSSGQPKILDYLLDHEGRDQKTIAAYCEIGTAAIASLLFKMEQDGLIERRQKDNDRRSLFVYLTPKGKEAAVEMHDVFDCYDSIASTGLSDAEVFNLKNLLTKVCDNLSGKEK